MSDQQPDPDVTIEPGGVELHHDDTGAPSEVPEKAADVKAWLDEDVSADERIRRANLAEAAEAARSDGPRSSVTDAITAARARQEGTT